MSIFRDSFSPEVRQQLLIRGQAIKDRTPKGLQYFNGRNAWVRMSSGVDINDNNSLALDNILYGGLKVGLGSAYSNITNGNKNLRGIRPMPGITSVEVQSKSAYGSLRQVTVNFICHDIKQLELLELLYMRPGFTILVEWGWAPYLDNSQKLSSNIDFYNNIWIKSTTSIQSRFKELFQKSRAHSANYDAILGYVKNYEWSARMDGSFDCKTEIISIGEIIESLKINYTPVDLKIGNEGYILKSSIFDQTTYGIDFRSLANSTLQHHSEDIKEYYQQNMLAGILSELKFMTDEIKLKASLENPGIAFEITDDGSLTNIPGKVLSFYKILISTTNEEGDEKNKISKERNTFLDLESFMDILNKHIIVHDKESKTPLVPLSLRGREYISQNQELLCLSHPLQISVDPRVCLIKNEYYQNISKIKAEIKILETVLPTNEPDTIKGIRYQAQIALNAYIGNNELKTFASYYSTYLPQGYSFKDLSIYLADAFEEYKQKSLIIGVVNGLIVHQVNYYIGSDKITDNDIDASIKVPQESLANRINRHSSFAQMSNILNINVPLSQQKKYTTSELSNKIKELYKPAAIIKLTADESLKKQIETDKLNRSTQETKEATDKNLMFLKDLKLPYFYQSNQSGKEFGKLTGIYVNLGYALLLTKNGQLESEDKKEKREINLYDYLKSLMKGIQESIGSLNHFDIHVDPIDGIARIIDINYIDEQKTEDAYNNSFTFLTQSGSGSLDGHFNNIRSYKMNSQIFKEQSTIVAISAQNGGGEMGLDNDTLVGWNTGLKDRILPDKGAPNSLSTIDQKIAILNNLTFNLNILTKYFKDLSWFKSTAFGATLSVKDRVYNSEESERYKNSLRDLIVGFKALGKRTCKNKSPIPTKLSIELDGIGGMIIGHIFRMPDELIPTGYKIENNISRKFGYIITGIAHSITNDWVTKLDSQIIILEDPDGENVDVLFLMQSPDIDEVDIDITNPGDTKITIKPNSAAIEKKILQVIKGFQSRGYDNKTIAAMVGNFLVENSSLNSSIINPDPRNQATNGGIAQWQGARFNQLRQKYGANWVDLDNQVDFVDFELKTGYRLIKSDMDTVSDVGLKAEIFDVGKDKNRQGRGGGYEQSAGTSTGQRIAQANYIYLKYLKG